MAKVCVSSVSGAKYQLAATGWGEERRGESEQYSERAVMKMSYAACHVSPCTASAASTAHSNSSSSSDAGYNY